MFSPFSSLGPLLAEKQREVVPCFPLFPFPLQFLLYPNCYRRERREESGKFLIDQCFCPPTSALRCLNLTLCCCRCFGDPPPCSVGFSPTAHLPRVSASQFPAGSYFFSASRTGTSPSSPQQKTPRLPAGLPRQDLLLLGFSCRLEKPL